MQILFCWKDYSQQEHILLTLASSRKRRQSVASKGKKKRGKKSLIKVKLTSVVVCWLKAAAAKIVLCANSDINTHQGSCEWITAPLTAEEAQQQVVNKSYSLRLDLTGFGTYNALFELF